MVADGVTKGHGNRRDKFSSCTGPWQMQIGEGFVAVGLGDEPVVDVFLPAFRCSTSRAHRPPRVPHDSRYLRG